jgi:uncharacterized RDD family membrane protein YckC
LASKTIEISTALNVTVTYELGTVLQRVLAGLLDSVFVWVFNLLRWLIWPPNTIDPAYIIGMGLFFIWVYQLFIIVFFKGRSAGMRIMGIRIMGLDGKNLEFSDYFLRWIMRPIDITISFCAVGIFSMLSTEKRQRLGDILAGTAVVKQKPISHFTLKDILSFHQNTGTAAVKYPQVRFVDEANMLFVKNLLQNQAGYSLEVHKNALDMAADNLCKLLQLDEKPFDARSFLNQLVNDYIVLTR